MNTTTLLNVLKPEGYGDTCDVEPAEEYFRRVRELLPEFPQSVVGQWLHRHYTCAVSDYGWIGLRGLRFKLCRWTTEDILAKVKWWPQDGLIDSWTSKLQNDRDRQTRGLGAYMIRSGTWPEPIMVIENNLSLKRPDQRPLASPYHLMEGCHRLGYFRALAADERWKPAFDHELWLVSPDANCVLDYWPLNE